MHPVSSLAFAGGATLSQAFNLRYEPLSIASGPVSLGFSPTLAGDIERITSSQGVETFTHPPFEAQGKPDQ